MSRISYLLSSVFSAVSVCFLFLAVVLSCNSAFAGTAMLVDDPRCDLCGGTCGDNDPTCVGSCEEDGHGGCGNVIPQYICACAPYGMGGCNCF